jgi:Family of unknown function (DUF6308)
VAARARGRQRGGLKSETLRVERDDGEQLVLAGLSLARAFFASDTSAQIKGFDPLRGLGDPNRIVIGDVIVMNTTMRSRSKHSLWDPVLGGRQRWLRDISPELDVLETGESEWRRIGGDALLAAAIKGCIHPGIGLAGATKMLHLKRPRCFPILDQLVAEMIGVGLPDGPTVEQRLTVAQRLASTLRREGRRNLDGLRRIQADLAWDGIERPLIRIFDAILWSSHPAARVTGATRSIAVSLKR